MPTHKRPENIILVDYDDDEEESLKRRRSDILRRVEAQQEKAEDEDEGEKDEAEEGDGDSDGNRFSDDPHKLPEWVSVDQLTIRVNVRCPICLGIIKKTRTMMDCLHRFCRECIDKSMRLGNNECPACRKHCASRRSLRDDPRFDAFIESLFDDVEKFEEEELAFHEEEETRNKQIQASIAKISQKQTEAVVKKRNKRAKDAHSVSNSKGFRRAYTRRRGRRNEPEESEDNGDEDNHNGNKESSSGDERRSETKKRRYRRRRTTQPSISEANSESSDIETGLEEGRKEIKSTPSGPMRTPELFAWGRAGARSKSSRKTRLTKLTEYLEREKENNLEQVDVHIMLISSDEQRVPNLQQSFLYCPPRFTVEHLKEYVTSELQLLDNNIDILLVKTRPSFNDPGPSLDLSTSVMQVLEGQKTLADVRDESALYEDHLILAYRMRKGNRQVGHKESEKVPSK